LSDAAGGSSGFHVSFSNQNGTDHGARYLRSVVQTDVRQAIIDYLSRNHTLLGQGWNVEIVIRVGDTQICYRVYNFGDGTFNVGTYWELP
jgi:hypothetical protein